jgi:Protein of unknown function DUF2617
MLIKLDAERRGQALDLRLTLGLEAQPALDVLDLEVAEGAGTKLQLRLLDTGHQVLLDTPDGRISETVARLPGPQGVSAVVEQEIAGRIYLFQGEVKESVRMVRDMVQLYAAEGEDMPHILRAIFPGEPDAFSEVRAELRGAPKRVKWTTVHTYPHAGELLLTRTTVILPSSR